MQKLNTLSETGLCLVVIGCLARAGVIRCTVRKLFVTSLTSQTENKKNRHFPPPPPSCDNILRHLSVFRNAFCFLEALPPWTF